MLLFNLHSHACISSLYSHWHWFSAFFGINRLYKSLIVNSISLESGRGATQEKVWIGWEVPEAIGMCFDSLSSFSLLADIVMIAFVGWWSHILSKEGFNFLKLLQQSTLQKTKKLTSSVKAPVTRLWSVHVVIWWNTLQRILAVQLNRFDEVRESDQLRHTVIGFSGIMQVLVWFETRTGTCIPLTPAFFVLTILKQFDYGTNYAEKFDRDVHRDQSSTGYWDFVEEGHVCQPSLLLISTLPYSLSNISSIKNPFTDDRDAELNPEQYLMQVLCRWDVVLYLWYRVFDVGDWMLFCTLIDDPKCDFFGRISWRSAEIFLYRLSSHSTYETHTSVTQ